MPLRRTRKFRYADHDHDHEQFTMESAAAAIDDDDTTRRKAEEALNARLDELRKELLEKSQIQLEQSFDTCSKLYETMPSEPALQLAGGIRMTTLAAMELLEREHGMQVFLNPEALLRLQRELYNDCLSRIISDTYAFVVQSRLMKEASEKLAGERDAAAAAAGPPAAPVLDAPSSSPSSQI